MCSNVNVIHYLHHFSLKQINHTNVIMHKRYENCVPNLPMHKMKNYDRGVVQFNICPKVRGLLAHENLKFLKFKTRDFRNVIHAAHK